MEWVGGTKQAIKLIDELIKSGDLINFYSRDFFKSINDDEVNADVFENLIKKHGDEFIGHLLIGCFHGNEDLLMKLVNLVKIEEKNILQSFNGPTFVFFNLKAKSILLFGMWRRKKQTIESIIYSASPNLIDSFEKLDYLNIIDSIRGTFEQVAEGMYPTNDGYSMGELDEMILGKNGRYFLDEDEANEVDADDEYEGEEKSGLDERRSELEYAQELREDAESALQHYFPKFSLDYLWD